MSSCYWCVRTCSYAFECVSENATLCFKPLWHRSDRTEPVEAEPWGKRVSWQLNVIVGDRGSTSLTPNNPLRDTFSYRQRPKMQEFVHKFHKIFRKCYPRTLQREGDTPSHTPVSAHAFWPPPLYFRRFAATKLNWTAVTRWSLYV